MRFPGSRCIPTFHFWRAKFFLMFSLTVEWISFVPAVFPLILEISSIARHAPFPGHSTVKDRCAVEPCGNQITLNPIRWITSATDQPPLDTYIATFVAQHPIVENSLQQSGTPLKMKGADNVVCLFVCLYSPPPL